MRYEEYKDFDGTWLKQLPFHWKTRKIKYQFDEISDKGHPDGVPLVASQHMGVVPKDIYGQRTVVANKGLELFKKVEIGDFVISLRSFQGGLEYAYYEGIISPAYTILRNKNAEFSGYYRYLFKSAPFIKLLTLCVTGIREGQNIDYQTLKQYSVPVPPREEQDQIVRYLDWKVSCINKLIHGYQRQIKLLEERKKALISYMVTHDRFSNARKKSEIYWLTDVPANWRVTRLKHILQKQDRAIPDNAELLICSNHGKVVPRGDTKLGLVAENDNIYQGVKKGDLLIHGMDTWHGAIAISNYDGMCTPVVHVCTSTESPRFICYYLRMMAFTKVFKAISNGVRQNTSDFRSWDKAGDLFIALPSRDEQEAIANIIDEKVHKADLGIEKLKKQISFMEEYRTRLISDVVTGQMDVRNIEIPEFEAEFDFESDAGNETDEGDDTMNEEATTDE
jgi:type I restriction enzyme, S subunit